MGLIAGGTRCSGKSTFLIKLSSVNQIPIVVLNNVRKNFIKSEARKMNCQIPEPIIYTDTNKFRGWHGEVLIDDIEDILSEVLVGSRIVAMTTSHQLYPLTKIKREVKRGILK